jgi:hypothetical protein
MQESPKRLAGDDLDEIYSRELRPVGEDGEVADAGPVEQVFTVLKAGGLLRTSTRPTLNLLLLLR